MIILYLVVAIIFGFICYKMAETRGRDKGVGFVFGLLFGLFAVIGYAIAGQTKEAKLKEFEEMMKAQERAKRQIAEQDDKIVGLIKPDIFSRFFKKELSKKSIGEVFGVAMIIFLVLSIIFSITSKSTEKEATEKEITTQQAAPKPAPEPKATIGEKNSVKKAQEYLNLTAFSRDGLITQLEYEGFTRQQAEYGANNSGANWNEQAAKAAKNYLNIMSFSRSGLIIQLEFEGYTSDQAEYGVKAVGY